MGWATALRFDYEHPPFPPQPSRIWHGAKWLFNRLYWGDGPTGPDPRASDPDAAATRRRRPGPE